MCNLTLADITWPRIWPLNATMANVGIIFLGRQKIPHVITSHLIYLLPEVCRSVIFGPPCIDTHVGNF